MYKKIIPVLIAVGLLQACASIVGSETQNVLIKSAPDQAQIFIKDENGIEVFNGKTPTTVTLSKSTGKYWGKKSYIVSFSKPGFKGRDVALIARPNGWYLAGNLPFGPIGWFVVDPFNGKMYTLSPETVQGNLDREKISFVPSSDSITVVLIEQVPQAWRDEMKEFQ